jgi:hypothetical protein
MVIIVTDFAKILVGVLNAVSDGRWTGVKGLRKFVPNLTRTASRILVIDQTISYRLSASPRTWS